MIDRVPPTAEIEAAVQVIELCGIPRRETITVPDYLANVEKEACDMLSRVFSSILSSRKTSMWDGVPLNEFEFSVRTRNSLHWGGVRTIGDLLRRTPDELRSYKNFGELCLRDVQERLEEKGLRIGQMIGSVE